MFNLWIEKFQEDFCIKFMTETYIDENTKVLIDAHGEKLYLICKYNTITCKSKGFNEVYDLERVLVDSRVQLKWIKRI